MAWLSQNDHLKVCFDSGNYECQISTTPHISRVIQLVVQGNVLTPSSRHDDDDDDDDDHHHHHTTLSQTP